MRGLYLSFCLAAVANAAQVYIYPRPKSLPNGIPPAHASSVIAYHLQLEAFEPAKDAQILNKYFSHHGDFVGNGPKSAMLLRVDEDDARGASSTWAQDGLIYEGKWLTRTAWLSLEIIPQGFRPSINMIPSPPSSAFSAMIQTSLSRAHEIYTEIFTLPSPDSPSYTIPRLLDIFSLSSVSTDKFLTEASALIDFLETPLPADTTKFGAFEIEGLRAIKEAYGKDSEQYTLAASTLKATMESLMSRDDIHLVLLTAPPTTSEETMSGAGMQRRQAQSAVMAPSFMAAQEAISGCFTTADSCSNGTSACSGRGECVGVLKAGRTCYVCSCVATQDDRGRTENWAGQSCERKDVSE